MRLLYSNFWHYKKTFLVKNTTFCALLSIFYRINVKFGSLNAKYVFELEIENTGILGLNALINLFEMEIILFPIFCLNAVSFTDHR